jgi:RHS repeat-associated protein
MGQGGVRWAAVPPEKNSGTQGLHGMPEVLMKSPLQFVTSNPPAGQVWRKYYLAGGQRLAMRVRQNGQNDELYYLLTDHLGSTSVSYDAVTGQVIRQKYMPWGELRGTENALPTDYTFTGQKWEQETGLMDFKARLYDPKLGRFISTDSVVPGGVQGLDRYAFVFNNPLRNTDPSGHNPKCGPDGLFCDPSFKLKSLYNCENCTGMDLAVVSAAVKAVANALGSGMNLSAAAAFWSVYGNVTFARVKSYTAYVDGKLQNYDSGAITKSANRIEFASLEYEGIADPIMAFLLGANQIIHDLGHAFASMAIGANAYSRLNESMEKDPLLRRDNPIEGYSYGFASGYTYYLYQYSWSNASTANEIFADMFVGYITGEWFTGTFPEGWGVDMGSATQLHVDMSNAKSNWINQFMSDLWR